MVVVAPSVDSSIDLLHGHGAIVVGGIVTQVKSLQRSNRSFGVAICRCGRIVTDDVEYFQLVRRYQRLCGSGRGYETLVTFCGACARSLVDVAK